MFDRGAWIGRGESIECWPAELGWTQRMERRRKLQGPDNGRDRGQLLRLLEVENGPLTEHGRMSLNDGG